MILGLSSYTYGWAVGVPGHRPTPALDEHGLMDRCEEFGLLLLQIGDNLPLHTFEQPRLDRLAARGKANGLQLELGARGLRPSRIADYAGLARRLGVKLLRFVVDEPGYHPSPEEVVRVLRDSTAELEGLMLGLENHDRFPARTLRWIVEAVGSERVGICLDTANSFGAGEGLATVVAELGDHVVNLHIKDFSITRLPHQMGFTIEGRPAGAGMLDVPWLLQSLASSPRCQTAVLELWTPPEQAFHQTLATEAAWAAQSVHYLRPYFINLT